jgi:hypothetical protein
MRSPGAKLAFRATQNKVKTVDVKWDKLKRRNCTVAQAILNAHNFQIIFLVRYFHVPYRIFSHLHYKAQRRVFVGQQLYPLFASSIRFLVQDKIRWIILWQMEWTWNTTWHFQPTRKVSLTEGKWWTTQIYVGNSISKLQIQVATYVFELSAGNCHR